MADLEPLQPPYQNRVTDPDGYMDRGWLSYFMGWAGKIVAGAVNQVTGTSGRIQVTGTQTNPVVNIDPAYVASAAQGGTGQSTYAVGDTLYASGVSALSKLPGNTSANLKILTQTGSGSASAAPAWKTRTEIGPYHNVLDYSSSGTAAAWIQAAADAADAAGGGFVIAPPGTYDLADDVTIPATVTFEIVGGGVLTSSNTSTITFNGSFVAPNRQVFSGDLLVLFGYGSCSTINPLWWGAYGDASVDCTSAFQKAIACAKASSYVRKILVPGGYYRITSRLEIDRNSIWFHGSGRQNTYIYLDATTDIVMAASGYTNCVDTDIGKVVTGPTVLLRLDPLTFTNAVAGDIGKTVTGGTSTATGRLVRYSNNLAAPFYEAVQLTGTFQSAEVVSVTTGTGTGTTNASPSSRTNTGTLEAFDNTTRTWTIKGTAGFFWSGMDCTITSGTGVGQLSSDASDSTDSAIKCTVSGSREYITISDIGFVTGSRGHWAAIDASSAPNVIIRNIYTESFGTGLLLGNSWNACVDNCNLILCRQYGVNAPSNTNDTCFLNVTVTCDDTVGTRCYFFESCYGVSLKGGAQEDADWAIEIQSSNVSYDGYMESHNRGNFCFTGNQGLLNVVNLITSNPGDRSVFFAPASDSRIICEQITIYNSPDLDWVFELRGAAVGYYGLVRSDDSSNYGKSGTKFKSYVTGIVASILNSDPYPTLNFSTREAASSPVAGDTWWNSTTKSIVTYIQSMKQAISTAFYTQMSAKTVANTVTETTLLDTSAAKGTATLPANWFADGKSLRINLSGVLSITGVTTLTIKVKIGSVQFGSTGAATMAGTVSGHLWEVEMILTCRSASASGSLQAQGKFLYDNSTHTGAIHGMANASTTGGFDTTSAQAIDVTATWGTADAGNTITCTNAVFESVNAVS